MYIEPKFQLPERAQSLHTPVDWQAVGEQLANGFRAVGEAFAEAVRQIVPAFQILGETIEDALRDNAYHPDGPVIRSTGFGLPDNLPSVGQPLLEGPLTVWSDRTSKIEARAFDEAGKRFLEALSNSQL